MEKADDQAWRTAEKKLLPWCLTSSARFFLPLIRLGERKSVAEMIELLM